MSVIKVPIVNREQWLALRRQDVTASDVGAVFGLHPYKTPLALWAEKSEVGIDTVETSAMRRGRWLEDAVISACRDHHPEWQIEKPNVYVRDGELRIGATPDAIANGNTVIQCKTVADKVFKASWQDGPPIHYQMQTLTEAMLWNAESAIIAVLVVSPFGADYHEYPVARHEAAEARIRKAVPLFWERIAKGEQPKPDYAADAALISSLYAPNEALAPIDLTADNYLPALLAERESVSAEIDEREERLKAIKCEIVEKLGGATVATLNGWTITNKMQHRKEYVAKASSFAVLRVTKHKQEQAA